LLTVEIDLLSLVLMLEWFWSRDQIMSLIWSTRILASAVVSCLKVSKEINVIQNKKVVSSQNVSVK